MAIENTNQEDLNNVQQALSGDQQAFNNIVLKYQNRIRNIVASYASDSGEAEDIAQECFIKAYRALDKFRHDSSFYTWLYRIAINTARSYTVSQRKHRQFHEYKFHTVDSDFFDISGTKLNTYEDANPEQVLISDETKDTIFATIEDMPINLKNTLMLREIDGLSYSEVADVMDCPLGTVRSRIFRARVCIDDKLNEFQGFNSYNLKDAVFSKGK